MSVYPFVHVRCVEVILDNPRCGSVIWRVGEKVELLLMNGVPSLKLT